jgi:hypothetical protein
VPSPNLRCLLRAAGGNRTIQHGSPHQGRPVLFTDHPIAGRFICRTPLGLPDRRPGAATWISPPPATTWLIRSLRCSLNTNVAKRAATQHRARTPGIWSRSALTCAPFRLRQRIGPTVHAASRYRKVPSARPAPSVATPGPLPRNARPANEMPTDGSSENRQAARTVCWLGEQAITAVRWEPPRQ